MDLLFYYDVVCPYAYLASTRIEALAARVGARLCWQPILLGGVFKAIGRDEGTMPAAKARLNLLDITRQAAEIGVPLALPAGHPRRTVAAMRLLHCTDGEARVRLTHALYRAYWVEGRDLSDRGVVDEMARAHGVAPSRIDGAKDALFAATDEAVKDGVFGVPGMVVIDGERRTLYWGNDRMHLVGRALGGHPAYGPPPSSAGGTVDFFYDFSSPFAYLASTQIERVAREQGASVRFRPF